MAERDPRGTGINISDSARVNRIEVHGDVIGVYNAMGDDARAAQDRQQLLAVLARLQEQVTALEDAPTGLREDAGDELQKAQKAAEQGDRSRFLEKLESAKGYLERVAELVPVGLQMAQTVATIAQRAQGLW